MRKYIRHIAPVIDLFVFPLTFLSSVFFLFLRKTGVQRFPLSSRIFKSVGVFPIFDHYYEPMFNRDSLQTPPTDDRFLPGIRMNVTEQLQILKRFDFNDELLSFPTERTSDEEYYYNNSKFGAGDAEYYYNIIRSFKPARIVEIGCGHSTKMAINAIAMNKEEDAFYSCEHTCIEPYERPWLKNLGINLIRERIEQVGRDIFADLGPNDILFIDSSHIIRPQGDVLFEILEVLPTLDSGVLVHIHDVFTPADYPAWDFVHFYNEQYLLEAFLTCNSEFRIIGALSYLQKHHLGDLLEACPVLGTRPDKPNGSFWITRN